MSLSESCVVTLYKSFECSTEPDYCKCTIGFFFFLVCFNLFEKRMWCAAVALIKLILTFH